MEQKKSMTFTTKEIVELYGLVNPAKLTKMTDSKAKFAIIRDNRQLKEVADGFEAFRKDALEKLKPEDFDEWSKKAQKWQGKTATTADEQQEVGAINTYFARYNSEVGKCLEDEYSKEHELELEKIDEAQFEQLCDSNDWTVEQCMTLYDRLVKAE